MCWHKNFDGMKLNECKNANADQRTATPWPLPSSARLRRLLAKLDTQAGHSLFAHSRNADGCTDGVALTEAGYHAGAIRITQAIHSRMLCPEFRLPIAPMISGERPVPNVLCAAMLSGCGYGQLPSRHLSAGVRACADRVARHRRQRRNFRLTYFWRFVLVIFVGRGPVEVNTRKSFPRPTFCLFFSQRQPFPINHLPHGVATEVIGVVARPGPIFCGNGLLCLLTSRVARDAMRVITARLPIEAILTSSIALRHLRRLEPHVAALLITRTTGLSDRLCARVAAAYDAAIIVARVFGARLTHFYAAIICSSGWLIAATARALTLGPARPRRAQVSHLITAVALVPYQLASIPITSGANEVLHREVAAIGRADFSEVPEEVYFHNFVSVIFCRRYPRREQSVIDYIATIYAGPIIVNTYLRFIFMPKIQ